MPRSILRAILAFGFLAGFVLSETHARAEDAKWGMLKGQIAWKGAIPKQQVPLPFGDSKDKKFCQTDKQPWEEDFVVDKETRGLKDVFVWIRPAGAKKDAAFPPKLIHPDLKKPEKEIVEIDQPCCRFIPHVLAARSGQKLIIKNSASVAHNAFWNSTENGAYNPIIPAGKEFNLFEANMKKALVAESGVITVSCSLHMWMKAYVRVFDHPYFAVTDEKGNFVIKTAPVGNFDLFIFHPASGYLGGVQGRNGYPITIKEGDNDAGKREFEKSAK